jgi:glycosyltransferase 2 family protein
MILKDVLKLSATAAAGGALFLLTDVGAAISALGHVSAPHLAGAGALYALIHFANTAKLRLLAPERSFAAMLKLTLSAQAYAFLLPGQLAVEAARAYRLGRGAGPAGDPMGGGRAASLVAFDKLTGLGAVLALMAVGLAFSSSSFGAAAWAGVAAAAVALIGLTWILSLETVGRMVGRMTRGGAVAARFGAALERFAAAWRENARSPRRVVASLGWGLVVQGLQVAGCWVLGLGLGLPVEPAGWCVVVGGLTLALLAPLTVAGIGVREGSLVGLLGVFGVSSADALAVAFALLGFQLIFSLIGLGLDVTAVDRRGDGA